MQDSIINEPAAIVGPDHLLTTPDERWCYAFDATDRPHMPDLVVFPGSAAEIAAIVHLANENRFPETPWAVVRLRPGAALRIMNRAQMTPNPCFPKG